MGKGTLPQKKTGKCGNFFQVGELNFQSVMAQFLEVDFTKTEIIMAAVQFWSNCCQKKPYVGETHREAICSSTKELTSRWSMKPGPGH